MSARSSACARRQRLCGAGAGDHQQGRLSSSPIPRCGRTRRAEELAEIAALAAVHVRRFGIEPKIAFLSHSDFGSYDTDSARKMRRATAAAEASKHPELEADGEMQGDTALSAAARKLVLPHPGSKGEANMLIMPNLDAANIAYQMIKVAGGRAAGRPDPDRPGAPAHILTPSVTARGIVNMTAVAVVEAQERAARQQPTLFT